VNEGWAELALWFKGDEPALGPKPPGEMSLVRLLDDLPGEPRIGESPQDSDEMLLTTSTRGIRPIDESIDVQLRHLWSLTAPLFGALDALQLEPTGCELRIVHYISSTEEQGSGFVIEGWLVAALARYKGLVSVDQYVKVRPGLRPVSE
jgi:hypothetical protein